MGAQFPPIICCAVLLWGYTGQLGCWGAVWWPFGNSRYVRILTWKMEHSFCSQYSCSIPRYPANSMHYGHLVQSSNAHTPGSNYKNSLGDSCMVPPCPLSQVATSSRQVRDFPLLHGLHSHHNLVSSKESVPMFSVRACHIHTSIQFVKDIPGTPCWSHPCSTATLQQGQPS